MNDSIVKAPPETSISKTLDRGLSALEFVTKNPAGVTVTEVANHLKVHRTIAHRLIGTLQLHSLVRRSETKVVFPAGGLIRLSESVDQDLRAVARPILQDLADTVGATANLVVEAASAQVQALMVIEPSQATAHIAFRAGQISPIERGSGGLAILAAGPVKTGERPEVSAARARGYAVSEAEIIPSAWGVSADVQVRVGMPKMSIGVTLFDDLELEEFGPKVAYHAGRLASLLGAADT